MQVSAAAVAVVDQGPIRKLVNEVAGIFRKWMEGNAVDNDQRILLRLASQHLSNMAAYFTSFSLSLVLLGEVKYAKACLIKLHITYIEDH